MAQQELRLRPKYEDIVSVDIMDGLGEFCRELSDVMLPSLDDNIPSTLPLMHSVRHSVRELTDNLNESIIRIEELKCAGNSLTVKFRDSESAMEHLECRVDEIEKIMHQIDVVEGVISKIQDEFVDVYWKRLEGVRTSIHSENAVSTQLKRDPIRTIKEQGIKSMKQSGPTLKRLGRSLLQFSRFGGKGNDPVKEEKHLDVIKNEMEADELQSQLPIWGDWHSLIQETEVSMYNSRTYEIIQYFASVSTDGKPEVNDPFVSEERAKKISIDLP